MEYQGVLAIYSLDNLTFRFEQITDVTSIFSIKHLPLSPRYGVAKTVDPLFRTGPVQCVGQQKPYYPLPLRPETHLRLPHSPI